MSHRKDQQQGFTLIELMLSMTFIAIMLVAIAMCVIQMSTIYTRAETLRQINQSSRTISNDLRQTLAGANQFVVNADDIKAGRLCTGAYTYVWNAPSVPAVAATDMSAAWPAVGATANKYIDSSDVIGFVRVQDAAGAYCGAGRTTAIPKAKAVELLPAGDRALTVRRLRVVSGIQDSITKQQLYTFDIVLSTNNTNAIETTADSCVPPGGSGATNSELAYCAVNQISITVRAGVR